MKIVNKNLDGTHQVTEIPDEFLDVAQVIEAGARKHGYNTWLNKDNESLQTVYNFKSISGHVARGMFGNPIDEETGLHHFLLAICRLGYAYTRWKRGIDT